MTSRTSQLIIALLTSSTLLLGGCFYEPEGPGAYPDPDAGESPAPDASTEPDQPQDGTCGDNAGDHFRDLHDWPGEFCAAGALAGDAPEMPAPFESAAWTCQGLAGGADVTCEATRVDECSPHRRPPTGWTRITTGCNPLDPAMDCTRWGPTAMWSLGFPGGDGITRRLASGLGEIPQYLAIEIRTFDQLADAYGRITMDSAGQPIPRVPQQIVTISSCPGDFNEEAILEDTGCYGRPSNIQAMRWRGPDANATGAYETSCILQPTRTY